MMRQVLDEYLVFDFATLLLSSLLLYLLAGWRFVGFGIW